MTPRTPSGAAVPGAHPRPKRYPRQIVLMVSEDTFDRIEQSAARRQTSKSEAARNYLNDGIEREVEL